MLRNIENEENHWNLNFILTKHNLFLKILVFSGNLRKYLIVCHKIYFFPTIENRGLDKLFTLVYREN